ncbi:hypothetical protein J7T55_007667 [Diaporthe amygdali]|uniref:uncharacterized protein n=1 Tax=Phomopsis amygdali TaxID=1214568 RepID=UPI0022FDC57D|nr:uncharacterized protein J7T55_007667 [Diaporthe amygdali]KAJ0107478.1 hypothetical protein J7T55_007667 [Diaporthe amygdali]
MAPSRQGECYVGISVTLFAATAALALRLYARHLTRVRLGIDDYFCIVAYIFAAICSGLMFSWTNYGLGKILADVPRPQAVIFRDNTLYLYILEFTYAYSLGFSKLSILALYWRLFSLFRIRLPIITLFVATIIWLLCRTFLGLFHCYPIQAFWEGKAKYPNAVCPIDDAKFEFGTVVVHAFLDVTIFSLPIFQIQQLTFRTTGEKLAVLAIFASGAFVCIVSIVNLTQLYAFLHTDASIEVLYNTAPPALWGQIEINMAIVAISLPLVRPVLQKAFRGLFPTRTDTRGSQDAEHYPGWVHMEWLRKLTSISSSTARTGRTARTATTGVTGDTRHDVANDEVELTSYHDLDSFADAMTRTHTYATGGRVPLESGSSDFRNDLRVTWRLPPRSPVPGFDSILEIVSPKEAGSFDRSKV